MPVTAVAWFVQSKNSTRVFGYAYTPPTPIESACQRAISTAVLVVAPQLFGAGMFSQPSSFDGSRIVTLAPHTVAVAGALPSQPRSMRRNGGPDSSLTKLNTAPK